MLARLSISEDAEVAEKAREKLGEWSKKWNDEAGIPAAPGVEMEGEAFRERLQVYSLYDTYE